VATPEQGGISSTFNNIQILSISQDPDQVDFKSTTSEFDIANAEQQGNYSIRWRISVIYPKYKPYPSFLIFY